MAKNRYIEDYPAIGIRPIIDGRRGPMQLRENLEDQVLAMALAAKNCLRTTCAIPMAIRFVWSLQIARLGAYRIGCLCGEIPQRRRGNYTVCHTVLVLRLRNYGYGPDDD